MDRSASGLKKVPLLHDLFLIASLVEVCTYVYVCVCVCVRACVCVQCCVRHISPPPLRGTRYCEGVALSPRLACISFRIPGQLIPEQPMTGSARLGGPPSNATAFSHLLIAYIYLPAKMASLGRARYIHETDKQHDRTSYRITPMRHSWEIHCMTSILGSNEWLQNGRLSRLNKAGISYAVYKEVNQSNLKRGYHL